MALYDSKTYIGDLAECVNSIVGIGALDGATVMVTGAGGLVGSFLVDALIATREVAGIDVKVIATGRNLRPLMSRFARVVEYGRLSVLPLDVTSPNGLDVRADLIVHAASNSHPASIVGNPVGTIMANVDGTLKLLGWGGAHGCKKLLFVSSAEVYGESDPSIEALKEDYQGYVDPMQLRSCYPMSKRAAENICACWAEASDVETVVVRLSHTYGPSSTQKDSRASAQFSAQAAAGENIVLKSEGGQVRSYTYVADAVSGILTALTSGMNGNAYNVAHQDVRASIADFARACAAVAGTDVGFEAYTDDEQKNQTPISRLVLDSSKLQGLGWCGLFPLERGVKHDVLIRKEAR